MSFRGPPQGSQSGPSFAEADSDASVFFAVKCGYISAQHQNWNTFNCRMFAVAYFIYFQVSITGGGLAERQTRHHITCEGCLRLCT
jgi:hypothetical protein